MYKKNLNWKQKKVDSPYEKNFDKNSDEEKILIEIRTGPNCIR